MVINISKIKTEALLLFCKDLILSYKDNNDIKEYGLDRDILVEFNNIGLTILKEIEKITFSQDYYIRNRKNFRIKAILSCYDFINKEVSKNLKLNEEFNPSMLYFSLLTLWFKELNKESTSKEYIYFILYPYFQVYDKFLVNIKNLEFKGLNIKMIELAEKVIFNFDKYNLR
ncbi:hypothetical protein AFAEC_2104 [Aliarcobacter faecis]|uniref:hypothetical protein n=1 Tax=Aliarcobacter faecis TaxID=1564138 RepID=UPI00047BFC58|nr:hypothetical protein [Aliarcobacter faecis]QKF74249.1 hypothetical protein AFAEC_2104 [Aliarcobacter faecis]